MELNKIYHGNVIDVLKTFDAKLFHTIVTSPPYYALRDYGIPETAWPEVKWKLFGVEITTPAMVCCLGLEPTPEDFIGHMVLVFREAKRTLRDDGTIWCNIGDSYWGGKGKSGNSYSAEYQNERYNAGRSFNPSASQMGGKKQTRPTDRKHPEYKPKDLIGIPWMLAFALRSDGWYLRQDIIWSKPNPMPESTTDRCTKSHEYIFLLSKSHKYYFDARSIATPYKEKTLTTFGNVAKGNGDGSGMIASENWANRVPVRKPKEWKTPDGWDTAPGPHGSIHRTGREKGKANPRKPREGVDTRGGNQADTNGIPAMEEGKDANKRSVWTIATTPFKGAHFATFPPALIVDCVKAGSPRGGVVLDLFGGSGTTAIVASKLERQWVLIDLSEEYINTIANPRINKELGLFR